ncbi:MAG: tyrosine-type recombinase/integrase [Cephaloticoccus sp.]|nr:tyrosine-type recombinase/integrase [Cephaloticoccus sp.]MCF7761897.1 tyrosine-type recombinase/integrase [Cephaloticoccus sp.]
MNRSTQSLDTAAKAWLEVQRTLDRSPKSVYTYAAAFTNLGRFLVRQGIRDVGLVSPGHLTAWQAHLWETGCRAATLQSFTLIIKQWFNWQVAAGRLFQSPAQGLRTPRLTVPGTRCPSPEDMRRLLRSIKGRDRFARRNRAILETAYSTGARLAEMAALNLDSLDIKNRTIRLFGKGQRERIVPLTRTAVLALQAYLQRSRPKFLRDTTGQAALFVGDRSGRKMKAPAFTAVLRKHAAKVGLILTMHDIRRAFATHLLAGGAHPAAVKEMLGHQGYKHLRHYLKLHPEAALNAVRRHRIFG